MKTPRPVTVDFETERILPRPQQYPPHPVGVSIKLWGKKARYLAWGHSTGNNCAFEDARRTVLDAWRNPDGVLFHNAKFDVDVAETFMGAPRLPWDKYHDTLFLLFLHDPHAQELGLKPSATRLLNLPPEERDAVVDWLMQHQPVSGVRLSDAVKSENYAGAYIALAPGDVVGPYADGDTRRTEGLFKLLYPQVVERGMQAAYDRERRLMPILLDCERRGVPVDVKRLRADVAQYTVVQERLTTQICKTLKTPDLNLSSGVQLVDALLRAGKVDAALLGVTPKSGKPCTDKVSLAAAITDKTLVKALGYLTQLGTCLSTFMEPWLKTAEQKDSTGHIFTSWNQTRQEKRGGVVGTRTGRLSSTPNFQNIPNELSVDRFNLYGCALSPLPRVRSYIVPPKGYVFIDRDYSQQELRILAHFEDGGLRDAYLLNPWLDVHDHARTLINAMLKTNFERKPIKTTGFGLIYGMGLGALAVASGSSVEDARRVKEAYLATFPGLRAMYRDMKQRARTNQPLRTWGGRAYYCEPPRMVKGRIQEFDYKMVNVLIQGSAADCTKEAMIRYDEAREDDHLPILTVHDEMLAAVPRKDLARGMTMLRTAMESIEFDVPMLSEGTFSAANWEDLEDYDKKGVLNER